MQDDVSYPGNGLHQGGMVELKNGDWWFIIMQDRGPIGRVPYLVPVKWVNGWPMLGVNGKDVITYTCPNVGKTYPVTVPATSDEFNSNKLGLQWQWNHNPDNAYWSLTARTGFIRLTALQADVLKYARNTLTQRVQGPASFATVEMDVDGLKNGNVAGLGIFQFPYAYVAIQQKGIERQVVMCNDDSIIETALTHFVGHKIWFRTRVTDKDFTAHFYFSTDGKDFHPIGNELKMQLGLDWTANRFALFNYSTKEDGVGGFADFNWFRMIGK